jgi:lipooligosaccharide transport system ATP-binding protein
VNAPAPAVRAQQLVKRYGRQTAVDHLDLTVQPGGCFGILGPNGAGKTTLMKMVTCVSPPTEGLLEVLGSDVRGDRRALKRRLGVVPQGETLDADLTVRENLTSFAAYHDVPRRLAGERADGLLEFAQLSDRAGARVEELSGGMKRRLLIARALVNDPQLVVLDEPTTGLDPQARQLVWERLRSLRRQGKTLLVTTHYMEEAQRLCDRLAVMHHGRVIAEGSPAELLAAHAAPRVVEIHGSELDAAAIGSVVDGLARDIEAVGDRILIYTDDGEAITGRIAAAGIPNHGVLLREGSLEDVFLRLTGHALID